MRVREWAHRESLNEQTVWKWCRNDTMPVPFERTESGVILIHDPKYEKPDNLPEKSVEEVVCYARVSSSDQREDLVRQADRLKAFAMNLGFPNAKIVTEVGSGMSDRRRKLNAVLADPSVTTIIVEHRDRLARMNVGLVESALKAQGRRLVVVDDSEVDDDLMRDMTEVLTSFCARLYGRRSARHRADVAIKATRDA